MTKTTNPVSWFEIATTDIARAKNFYETVFNLELKINEMGATKMAMFPMIEGVSTFSGALVQGEGYTPSKLGTFIYFSVENIDTTLTKIKESGGKLITEKTDIGEYGWTAHFLDCEGNRVALHTAR